MSLGVDPLISNLVFSLNLIPHLSSVQTEREQKHSLPQYPLVSVILALYRENSEDILATVHSLAKQSYPKHRLQVLIVVEHDDIATIEAVNRVAVPALAAAGLEPSVMTTDGARHTKPYALNIALQHAQGEYCVFYDAADTFEPEQIEKGVGAMTCGGYDVAQCKVLRKGGSLLSKFLLLDTVVWYWKYVPLILRCSRGFPLSGEGLFIRHDVLREVGCFPDVLTEDTMLGVILTERNKHFCILDTVVTEKAPRNVWAHIRQKMRWHRGYLTCLRFLRKANIPLPRKFFFFLSFATPIASSLGALGWMAILYKWLTTTMGVDAPGPEILGAVLHYWSLFLIGVGTPITILSVMALTWRLQLRSYVPVAFGIPLYWVFVGCCATASLFRGTRDWGKTDR
jgi:cellulose synthase/poly-beta-1,6-N-acetylglucosamine synthase-like glycosyltransferase